MLTLLATLLIAADAPAAAPTVLPDELTADERAVAERLEDWRALWGQTGRGEVFAVDRYRHLFLPDEQADDMLTFDQYVPAWASTQIDGLDDFRTVWDRDVNESFPGWTITKMQVLRIEVSGDLAWSALNFWGDGTRDGEPYTGGQHGTHIWRDVDPGPARDWRIEHEHLTVINVEGNGPTRYDGQPPAPVPPRVDARRTGNSESSAFAGMSIDHVCLTTNDYDRLTRFYRDVLGFEFEEQWEAPGVVPGARLCYMRHPSGVRLEIVGGPGVGVVDPPASLPDDFNIGGIRHLCLAVNDLDAAYAEVVAKGAESVAEPFDYPRLQKRLAFVRDIDGNTIELVAPMGPAASVPAEVRREAALIEGPVTLVSRMEARPGEAEALAALLAKAPEGALRWWALRDAERPDRFALLQTWLTARAFAAHVESPGAAARMRDIDAAAAGRPSVQVWATGEAGPATAEAPDHPAATPLLDGLRRRVDRVADLEAPFVLMVNVPIADAEATRVQAAAVARATRAEPRNVDYFFLAEPGIEGDEAPHRFMLVESWPDFAAMEHHVGLPQFDRLMRTFAAHGAGDRSAELYVPLN